MTFPRELYRSTHTLQRGQYRTNKLFYPSPAWWSNEFTGISYGALVTQKHCIERRACPSLHNNSWQLHLLSSSLPSVYSGNHDHGQLRQITSGWGEGWEADDCLPHSEETWIGPMLWAPNLRASWVVSSCSDMPRMEWHCARTVWLEWRLLT